jgi:hypothetical membrane protein
MDTLAYIIIASGLIALLSLFTLHLVNPEFKISWRMVSEYAIGKQTWILTLFFTCWGICSLLSACLLWEIGISGWAMFGVLLVFISGIGAVMGGMFDVKHKLHGLSFALGVPTLPVGALLVSYPLVKQEQWASHKTAVLFAAHLPWISFVLMAVSMILLISGFKKAGVPMGPNVEPPKTLPKGVIGINGYVNRILIACYIIWCLVIAKSYLSF